MKSDCIEKVVTALGSLAAALAVPAGAMAATGSATGAAIVAGAVGLPLLGALAMGKPIWDAIRSDRRTACEAHIADGIRLARAGLEAAPDTRFGAAERAALDEAVAEILPSCLPTEEAQVREILTENALNGARIAEALLGNMPQEALDGPFREEGARNFFRDVVVAVWESLRAEPDFTATLRSHIDEAFFVRLDRVESKIDRLGEGQDDIRAMIAQVLANQQAASPDGDERERQVANLLHVILEEHVPAKQVPGAIETAIARVREMRDQLGGAPNNASEARRALYVRAQEALRVFDFDAAETAWREYRRLGRQERADRAREDARTDALETGRIAETLRARLRYREAAALYAEAAATVDTADADHRYEWLRRQWNALYDLGNEFGDNGALGECLTLARGMLDLYPQAVDADKWATSQNNLGNALLIAGQRGAETAPLHDAVSAYRSALTVLAQDTSPHRRATAQKNLGDALAIIGERENDLTRMNDAVAAYREALAAQDRERNPVEWATTMGGIGTALHIIARRENDSNRLQEGIAILQDALTALTPDRNPQEWAGAQINLGNALQALGEKETGSESLESAIAAYRMALTVFTRERMPLEWAGIQTNLGGALRMLGLRETGTESLSKAVEAHRQALLEFTRDRALQQWAIAQANLGGALVGLGERETGLETLEEAVAVLNDVLAVRSRESTPLEWAKLQTDLAIAYLLIASREGSREAFGPAVAACEDVVEALAGVHPERQAKARQLLAIVLDRRDQTGEPAS